MKTNIMTAILCWFVMTAEATSYELIVLNQGTNESCVYGLNNKGYSCGYLVTNGMRCPYLWSPDRKEYVLKRYFMDFTVTNGIAYSINDRMEMIGGYGAPSDGVYRQTLGACFGWFFEEASGTSWYYFMPNKNPGTLRSINNSSQVAGSMEEAAYTVNLRSSSQYSYFFQFIAKSYCNGINESNNMAGSVSLKGYFSPMFIQAKTNRQYKITVDQAFGANDAFGIKLNNSNEVVGVYTGGGFYWDTTTSNHVFFPGAVQCLAINDAGTIVGTSGGRACMWTKSYDSFVMTDLNTLTSDPHFVLETAYNINNAGQIVGQGLDTDTGIRRAFLLTPSMGVPASMTLSGHDLKLSWSPTSSNNYSIHQSEDLKTWTPLPTIYHVDDQTSYSVTLPMSRSRLFFQVFDLTP